RPGDGPPPPARRRADRLLRPPAPPALVARPRAAGRVPRHGAAPAGVHGERVGGDQPGRLRAAARLARRGAVDRPRVRGDALVLGAGLPAARADLADVPAADAAPRPRRGGRGGGAGPVAADPAVLLQPRPVADRAGAAGEGTLRRGAAAGDRHPGG